MLHFWDTFATGEFMKSKITSYLLIGLFTVMTSISAYAKWDLENAFFYIETYKKLCNDCPTKTRVKNDPFPSFVPTPNVGLAHQKRYLYTGRIEVNQINYNTYETRKIVIQDVKLMMELTGAIHEFTRGGNTRMRIKGLAGKTINDIFKTPFEGGKIKVQLGLNLTFMYAKNDAGISIIDNEDLFTWGAARNLARANLRFDLNETVNEIILYDSKGKVIESSTTTGPEILEEKI
jgi:hypothetical protein